MDNLLSEFSVTKSRIFAAFGCPSEYFVKFVENAHWKINSDNSMTFLTYSEPNSRPANCVVITREGKPMIYTYQDYTMVIAIECVKTALIFKTSKKVG